ncbi:hypothetical protein BGW37DRAFT_495256 [Umbelopsis sp. PMI_123]|nr:hypothetical protein BGW37DRAFT_495256 [Umbelopsis sp. PMI_123]
MTTLRRFSTAYLQSGRRKILIPYCEHDNSDVVIQQCIEDNTLLPTDSICLVNVVCPSLLSQLTAYSIMHGATPVSTTVDLTYAAQRDPQMEFLVSKAEDMLEKVAQRLRLHDLNVRTVVLEGDIRSSILNLTEEFRPDIIILTTGHTGKLKKLFTASISKHLQKNAKKSQVFIISPDKEREVMTTDQFTGTQEEHDSNDLNTGCTPKTKLEAVSQRPQIS